MLLISVSLIAVVLFIIVISQGVTVYQIKDTNDNQSSVIAELREANRQLKQEVVEYKKAINASQKQAEAKQVASVTGGKGNRATLEYSNKTNKPPEAKWEPDNSLTSPNNLASPLHPLNQTYSIGSSSKSSNDCDDTNTKHSTSYSSSHHSNSCHAPSYSSHSSSHNDNSSNSHSSSDYSSSSSSSYDSGSSSSGSDSGGSWD